MKKPHPKKRLSRYRPEKNAFPDLIIRDRDRLILHLVYEHRFLSGELIWHLLEVAGEAHRTEYTTGEDGKKRPSQYGFGQQALSKRLKQLFNARFLDRHYIIDQPLGRGSGTPRAIYGLGPKSAKLLAEQTGVPAQEIRDIVEANKVKSPFLRHALEVATFRVILELACRRSQGRVRLIFWEQGQCLRDHIIGRNEKGEDERFTIYPDAFFALEVEGIGKANYFLEVDRGTMPIIAAGRRTDIRKKILGYRHFRNFIRENQRYYYRTTPDGQVVGLHVVDRESKSLMPQDSGFESIRGFTVLFLVPGSLESSKKVKGRIANILSAFPLFGKAFATSSLFWFAPFDAFQIDSPQSVFRRAWMIANPRKGLQSLIE